MEYRVISICEEQPSKAGGCVFFRLRYMHVEGCPHCNELLEEAIKAMIGYYLGQNEPCRVHLDFIPTDRTLPSFLFTLACYHGDIPVQYRKFGILLDTERDRLLPPSHFGIRSRHSLIYQNGTFYQVKNSFVNEKKLHVRHSSLAQSVSLCPITQKKAKKSRSALAKREDLCYTDDREA